LGKLQLSYEELKIGFAKVITISMSFISDLNVKKWYLHYGKVMNILKKKSRLYENFATSC